ncbi:MAG TPA: hypothetical protein VGO30_11390 [Mycobacterium sp.]|nr:hypothetical protein [Mycobacterium sp.]
MARLGFLATLKKTRQILKARDVFAKEYVFTTGAPAQQVIDGMEHYCGRTVPTGAPGFYVFSVIEAQQVILRYGNQDNPRIFSARIDFQSEDPAKGTLWFFDAEVLSAGTEAADWLRENLAWLIEDLSPGSVLEESSEPVAIATWEPDENWTDEKRNRHRKK